MENSRQVIPTFALAGVAIGVFVRSVWVAVLGFQAWEDPLLLDLAPASAVGGLVAGILGFVLLLRDERARSFTDSVVTELRVVSWPSREETTSNTGIVVGASLLFASILAVYDFVWAQVTEIFLYSSG